ncbi:MAG: hypothetical protein ACRD8O_23795 [Bryobacteraceae bacterium]
MGRLKSAPPGAGMSACATSTRRNLRGRRRFRLSAIPPSTAVCGEAALRHIILLVTLGLSGALAQTPPVCASEVPVCKFLKERYDRGLAAGNAGDIYENLDAGHSYLPVASFTHPQVTIRVLSGGRPSGRDLDKIIVGNASLGVPPGPIDRHGSSIGRLLFMVDQNGAEFIANQYLSNHFYWFPGYVDARGRDVFNGMLPSLGLSSGDSFSEITHVEEFLYALAAFRPDVKAKLKEAGLLMPVIQMIFRRVRVANDEEYLTAKAHRQVTPLNDPKVDYHLATARMAAAMTLENLPPIARIKMIEDTYADGALGKDCFELTERHCRGNIYDTPVSVARVWRGFGYTKRMVVSLEDSHDLNSRPLQYRWALLSGDPERARITLLNDEGSKAQIDIDYHPTSTATETERASNLVVIGGFVYNGVHFSPPVFASSFTLNYENRTYDPESKRLLKIEYPAYEDRYVHANFSRWKLWISDDLKYNADGAFLSLIRGYRPWWTNPYMEFAPDGFQVLDRDADGRPSRGQGVRYHIDTQKDPGYAGLDWTADGPVKSYPE